MQNEENLIIYNTDDGKVAITLLSKDGKVWMNQKQLSELFDTSKQNISLHIANVLKDKELEEDSVVKYYLTTAADGKDYEVAFYSLDMILAIGFRVRSKRGVQFRKWANTNLSEYLVKGFVMDDDRLKNPKGRFDYFDELLERIRDIRASEKRFYQKVKDLFSLSSDYDASDKTTQMFFAEAQNKILFAITGKTAAELVVARADASAPNMALTSWKGKVVRKQDILIAKNYLTADEIDNLNRFVIVFLETAELRAKNRKQVTMKFWRENLDKIIEFNDKTVLLDRGSVSKKSMETIVQKVYLDFDENRKKADAELADAEDLRSLEELNEQLKQRGDEE